MILALSCAFGVVCAAWADMQVTTKALGYCAFAFNGEGIELLPVKSHGRTSLSCEIQPITKDI